MIPAKLKKGDGVRVIAPSRSLSLSFINEELKEIAKKRFQELGLKLSFGKYVEEMDDFSSTSIEHRLEDLHEAFADPDVKMVITVIGGFNSNQLLRYIDYELIRANPKIFCGYSDITALSNAIYAQTGLVTYSGPHFFSFGDKRGFDSTLDYFKKCLFSDEPFEIKPSEKWSDDLWSGKQDERIFMDNEGFWPINEGEAEGTIIGGNQCTLNLLHGTEFMPSLNGSILFLEEDYEAHFVTIDRDLQSIIHQSAFDGVRGIVFGRFQQKTEMTRNLLTQIVKSKKELKNIPVLANLDFGHTYPMITFPVGGSVRLKVHDNESMLELIKH